MCPICTTLSLLLLLGSGCVSADYALPAASPPIVRLSMREFYGKDQQLDRFGGAAAHEYGHVLFTQNFESKSEVFAAYKTGSATVADLSSYPGALEALSPDELLEVSLKISRMIPEVSLNYYTSAMPFPQELFVDSVSSFFHEDPIATVGLTAHDHFDSDFVTEELLTRDMSKAHPVPAAKHPSHRAMSAPIRNVVWKAFMKQSAPDLENRGKIPGHLAKVISEVEEARRENLGWKSNFDKCPGCRRLECPPPRSS